MKRQRVEPTADWQQLALLAAWPEQRAYEELRPVVLSGRPVAARAGETGTPERTLYRRVARFDAEGMASLFPPAKVEKHRRLPGLIRQHIRHLKAEHPAFRASETVKRILAEDPPPRPSRRFPPYHEIADPAERRLAIIRLHATPGHGVGGHMLVGSLADAPRGFSVTPEQPRVCRQAS